MFRRFEHKGMAPEIRLVTVRPVKQSNSIFIIIAVIVTGFIVVGLILNPVVIRPRVHRRVSLKVAFHKRPEKTRKTIIVDEKKIFNAKKTDEIQKKVRTEEKKPRIARHKQQKKHGKTKMFGITPDSTTKGESPVVARVGNTLMTVPSKKTVVGPKQPVIKGALPDRTVYGSSQVDQPPEFVVRAVPQYPAEAEEDEIEGTVIVSVIVDKKGLPVKVEKIKGESPVLFQAAKKAVMSSRFSPALYESIPVMCRVEIPYRFRLE